MKEKQIAEKSKLFYTPAKVVFQQGIIVIKHFNCNDIFLSRAYIYYLLWQ